MRLRLRLRKVRRALAVLGGRPTRGDANEIRLQKGRISCPAIFSSLDGFRSPLVTKSLFPLGGHQERRTKPLDQII